MKRCLSLIVLSFIILNSTFCQTKFKAFIGTNVSSIEDNLSFNISEEDEMELESIFEGVILPFAGFQLDIGLTKKLSINLESQLSFKGQKQRNTDYVERSLYVKLIPSFNIDIYKGLNVGIGPYEAYRPYTYFSEKSSPSSIIYLRENWDSGGMVSLSYELNKVSFRLAYYHGFSTVYSFNFPFDDGDSWANVEKKNKTIQLGIGYTF